MKLKDLQTYLQFSYFLKNTYTACPFPFYFQGYYLIATISETQSLYLSEIDQEVVLFEQKSINQIQSDVQYLIYRNQYLLQLTKYENEKQINEIKTLLNKNKRVAISELLDDIATILSE